MGLATAEFTEAGRILDAVCFIVWVGIVSLDTEMTFMVWAGISAVRGDLESVNLHPLSSAGHRYRHCVESFDCVVKLLELLLKLVI